LPREAAREVEWRLQLWYGIELAILAMMGEADLFNTHFLNNPHLRGRGLTVAYLFATIQGCLAQARGVPEVSMQALDPGERPRRSELLRVRPAVGRRFLALCEVALFPPVLLEHRPLRIAAVKSADILPFARWQRALRASASVAPMTSLTD
jgi:hypothetical protein